jgi:hypothetical protein
LVLNRLFSTRVSDIDVELLARRIAGLGIDRRLDQGVLEAVDLASVVRFIGWMLAIAMLTFCFAIIYY